MNIAIKRSKITMIIVEKAITNEMVEEKIKDLTYPPRTCPSG